jgi:2'-5' RNA ligase
MAPIISKYNALEFKISQFENWKGNGSLHVQLKETTNQLELLRQEIQEKVKEVAPGVEVKCVSPHISVGSTNEYITQDKLPVIDNKTYQVSKMDMMYHDDKAGKNVIADSFSTLTGKKNIHYGTLFKKFKEREEGRDLEQYNCEKSSNSVGPTGR